MTGAESVRWDLTVVAGRSGCSGSSRQAEPAVRLRYSENCWAHYRQQSLNLWLVSGFRSYWWEAGGPVQKSRAAAEQQHDAPLVRRRGRHHGTETLLTPLFSENTLALIPSSSRWILRAPSFQRRGLSTRQRNSPPPWTSCLEVPRVHQHQRAGTKAPSVRRRPALASAHQSYCVFGRGEPISRRETVSRPPEYAGSSTVHYYWGVPFCPRGLHPDSYTQVKIRAKMKPACALVHIPLFILLFSLLFPGFSGDPGSDGGLREESETGSEAPAEEGWVGGGHRAPARGTTVNL